MGIAFLLIRLYMWKTPEVTKNMSKDDLWIGVRNVLLFGPTPYLIGIIAAWIHPFLAFACYAFVTIYYIFPKSSALEQIAN
jgi:hypothetical protein